MSVPITLSSMLALIGVGAVSVLPVPGEPIMAVFPSSISQSEALTLMAASGGSLVSTTDVPWVILTNDDEPGLAQRLRRSGALATLNPRLAALCFGGDVFL
ncbi:MAG: hypothetical protein AAGH60_01485 [Pseudomonadota bacterium]